MQPEILKKYKLLQLKAKKKLGENMLGETQSIFRGQGLEFEEFAPYEEGSDSSKIDWITSLRENKLLTKKFREEKHMRVMFFLDLSETMEFGLEKKKIGIVEEVFTLLGMLAQKQKANISVILFGREKCEYFSSAYFGKSFLFEAFRIMDAYVSSSSSKSIRLKEATHFALKRKLLQKKSMIFFCTDEMLDSPKTLSQKHEVTYINIFDSFENTGKIYGKKALGLKFGKKTFIPHFFGKKKIEKYREFRKEKIDNFKKNLQKVGVNYILVDETTDFVKSFLELIHNK